MRAGRHHRRPTSASSSSARRRPTRFSRAPRACCRTRSARTRAWGFDLGAACSGFTYALTTGMQMVATGAHDHALVVGADVMSSIIDYTRSHDLRAVRRRRRRGRAVAPAADGEAGDHRLRARDRRQRRAGAVHARRRQPHAGVARDGRPAPALRQAGRGRRCSSSRCKNTEEICAPRARAQRPRAVAARSVRVAPGEPPHHRGGRRAARARPTTR